MPVIQYLTYPALNNINIQVYINIINTNALVIVLNINNIQYSSPLLYQKINFFKKIILHHNNFELNHRVLYRFV